MDSSQTILVTGATGSIGSVLVRRLCESGQRVRVLARSPEKAAKMFNHSEIEIVQGNLTQPESLHGCADGCALVYHCAAKLPGNNWETSRAVNVIGTRAIMDEAARAGAERFVYTSTNGVYFFSHAKNITEDLPFPHSSLPYIATKQEADRMVQESAGRIPTVIARLGDVVGPGQQAWTISFIEKIKQGVLKPPRIADSGFLNPVYIDNLIDALILMGEHPAAPGQVFNVVDGTPILMHDYIQCLARMVYGKSIMALPGVVIKGVAALLMAADIVRRREPEVTPGIVNMLMHNATVNGEKLRAVLGWAPAVDLEEGFQRTEAWLRSAGYLNAGK